MNCTDAQNLFGDAIDGTLSVDDRQEFLKHVSACGVCRRELELESVTKATIRKRIQRVSTPPDVRSFVLRSLGEASALAIEQPSWLERLFTGRRLFPSLATMFVVIALMYYFFPSGPSPEALAMHTSSNDVMLKTVQNFTKIREGQMRPSSVACDPQVIASYFRKNGLHFAADTKMLEDCDWYGASYSDSDGIQAAHVVYQMGEEIAYVYEVKKEEALEGSKLSLPVAARESLLKTGRYTDPLHPNCNIVVWTENGTLCSAVSTMSKDRLAAIFASR